MKKLLSSLSTLFLFLVTNVAFADSSSSSFMSAPAIANKTDLSVAYLDQVFGTVGNVLTGTSGQMLGHLFYQLNNGILIVAGLWLGYTVFTICVRSAQEGSFLGANKNVALVFLKIAFGMSLLIPYSATGYSLLQDITMKVVVEGVGLADEVWNAGLDYISSGGVVWHSPTDSGGSNALTINNATAESILGNSNSATKDNNTGMGQVIFANLVCMYASTDSTVDSNGTASYYYDTIEDDANNRFTFGGGTSGSNNACGAVSWNVLSVCDGTTIDSDTSDVDSTGSDSAMCATSRNAVYNMIQNLEPAAYNYYCSQYGDSLSHSAICVNSTADSDTWNDNVNDFFNGVVSYVNGILPVASAQQANYSGTDNFVEEAEKEGWLSAGRYYWDLAQTTSVYGQISNIDSYVPSNSNMSMYSSSLSGSEAATLASSALTKSYSYIKAGSGDNQDVEDLLANFNEAQDPGAGNGNYTASDDGLHGYVKDIVGPFINNAEKLINAFSANNIDIDPIAFLVTIGNYSLAVAGSIWIDIGAAFVSVMLMGIACQSEVNMSGPLAAAINWIQPLFMALAGMFLLVGAVLGFYVPLYPYMLFIFGVIGWIIAVIEAMVAAPLVCFGLTHPEGHDFLGEAKQALMLLLGIFLRPALMVMGLIAGMILSYVSLRILIYTFSGITSDMFTVAASGAAKSDLLGNTSAFLTHSSNYTHVSGFSGFLQTVLVFPIILTIFTSMVYAVVTQCFSLIYVLPDYIMRWIGGPVDQHRAGPAQLAGISQSAVSSGAQGIDQGAKGTMGQMGKSADEAGAWGKQQGQKRSSTGLDT